MSPNFYKRFRVLQRRVNSTDCKSKELEQCSEMIVLCSELLLSFFNDIEQYIQLQRTIVSNRYALQKQNQMVNAGQDAYRQYLLDQIAHLKQTTSDFQRTFFAQNESCLLDLTGRDILLFLRLMRDAGIVNVKQDLATAFTFIELHFKTNNQAHFSFESLRKKYSEKDVNQLQKMEIRLSKLLRINQ